MKINMHELKIHRRLLSLITHTLLHYLTCFISVILGFISTVTCKIMNVVKELRTILHSYNIFFSPKVTTLFMMLMTCCSAFADGAVLDQIYAESVGNNQYEAKVKAIDKAMNRALIIMADSLGLSNQENSEFLKKIPPNELREVFDDIIFSNEKSEEYLSGAKYSSTITFSFKQSSVNSLIKKYTSEDIREKFLSAMVIPVFKINKSIYFDSRSKGWVGSWMSARQKLIDNSLILLAPSKYREVGVNEENLFQLSFEQLISKLPNKLFNRVIIPTGEFITNKSNGNSLFRLEYTIISEQSRQKRVIEFNLSKTSKVDLVNITNKIIDDLIEEYGKPLQKNNALSAYLMEKFGIGRSSDSSNHADKNYYTFLMQINYDGELQKIQQKLNNIPDIKKFSILVGYEMTYQIKIYTDLDTLSLMQKFYDNKLSFFYNQEKNPVIINVGG